MSLPFDFNTHYATPRRPVFARNIVSTSHPLGAQVLSFTFGDLTPWPVTPDGLNFSLVPVNPNFNPDYDDPANWRASSVLCGSPGADDPAHSYVPGVVIHEILAHATAPLEDAIELHNPTESAIEIGGWR